MVGDRAGSPYFTHIGVDDFRVVLDNLSGGHRGASGRQVPFCLFTDPELARVGTTESQARAEGVPYRIARMPMAMVLQMHTPSQKRGFMTALVGADDRILGSTAFGAGASELMALAQMAMLGGIPYTVQPDSICTHPTAHAGWLGASAGGFPAMTGNVPFLMKDVVLSPCRSIC